MVQFCVVDDLDMCVGVSPGDVPLQPGSVARVQMKSFNATTDTGSEGFKLEYVYDSADFLVKYQTNGMFGLAVNTRNEPVVTENYNSSHWAWDWEGKLFSLERKGNCLTISRCNRNRLGFCSKVDSMMTPVLTVGEIEHGAYVYMSGCMNGSMAQIFEVVMDRGVKTAPSVGWSPTISPSMKQVNSTQGNATTSPSLLVWNETLRPSVSPVQTEYESPLLVPTTEPTYDPVTVGPSTSPSDNPSLSPLNRPSVGPAESVKTTAPTRVPTIVNTVKTMDPTLHPLHSSVAPSVQVPTASPTLGLVDTNSTYVNTTAVAGSVGAVFVVLVVIVVYVMVYVMRHRTLRPMR